MDGNGTPRTYPEPTNDGRFCTDGNNYPEPQSGGIVFMWKDNLVKEEEVSTTPQGLHVIVKELEAKLQQDFSVILRSEEDFWKLKSRVNWLSEGDANTKFFHISILNRRRRNRIISLEDEVGTNIQDPNDIKNTILNYVTTIYTTEHHSSMNKSHISDSDNVLTTREQSTINSTVRLYKIKCPLFSFKPWKAHGLDVLHPFFY
ncbi:uncharacterized protein LOC142176378 [Nicotiana tabacum]|uniref:Uncharacterized protein LOC142176378 n=1 Tax=Nicotiana tabacum TaxID=4097 RepID=A0AC58TRS2_TOBAC